MTKHRMGFYTLKGKQIIETNVAEWATFFQSSERVLASDAIRNVHVSTIFIGLDHLMFESMIFSGKQDGWTDRYSTYDEAMTGHKRALEVAFGPHAQTLVKAARIRHMAKTSRPVKKASTVKLP